MNNDSPQAQTAAPATGEETSVIEIVNAVLRNWRSVVILPVVLAFLIGIKSLMKERTYAAVASFVAQTGEGRGLSGAAALAQQFGVSLGGDRPGQSPQFYEDLLRSRTILRRAVESEYDLPVDGGQTRKATLIQYWRVDQEKDPKPAWRRAADTLRGKIATSVRRETGVIELTVASPDPQLAEQVAARLLGLLNDYNLEVRQARAREESRYLGGRIAESRGELKAAEDSLGAFLQQNRDFRNSPGLTFLHDRLQRQVFARQEVYSSLLGGQETARLDAMRDTPVLQIIDSPAGSAQRESRKVALNMVIAFMLGGLVAVAVAIVREAARKGRLSNDPHYREFEDLVRRMWVEFRHPGQWLRRKDRPAARPGGD